MNKIKKYLWDALLEYGRIVEFNSRTWLVR